MRVSQLAGLVAFTSSAAAAPTLRSSSPYAVKERHAVPPSWSVVGEAAKSHVLNMQIGLKQSNRDVLEQHVIEVSDPGHARYGQHLSAEEVNALVAPAADTLHLVTKWLREHGITEPQLSPAKDWIHVAIPVAKAEELLNTTYSHFKHVDGSDVVRTAEWSLPEHLHEHVDVIQPTTSFFKTSRQSNDIAPDDSERWWQPMPPQYHHPSPTPGNLSAICNASFTTLECIRTLYGTIDYVPQVPEKNAIGVTDYLGETQNRSDIEIYLNDFRPEAAGVAYKFPITLINGAVDQQTRLNATELAARGLIVEGDLDGELVIGISWPTTFMSWATGGSPPYNPDLATPTNTNEPYLEWLTYVLANSSLPQVISTSYGDDEQSVPYSYAKRVCDGFMQLGARGISVLFSSGDAGVGSNGTCFSNTDPTKAMFLPAFPASCPWVTSVGGTKDFQPEVAVSRFGSGAGFSNYFGRPAYQTAAVEGYFAKIGDLYAGLYNTTGRGYPDVAAQGNHDVIVWAGNVTTVGGTSASSPTFAAVIALVNDALIARGRPALGFLNPWIYGGAYRALNDITSGSSIGCNSSGFPAEVGWDAVTGYGTPNFGKLVGAAFHTGVPWTGWSE
ncbi:hypothetical protein LTR91_005266 [Friedmanniomyces endolithicus]|uniref:tripeptidyl-peptidase II n=1 Tax=Friedmanniomyces endolithicus TaxID=329885 RepID=A0AAN6QY19_9PEZI|nr:hypothetical protein LTR94_009682 [Friedmanniomyces endolithicus]KAK0773262.1 hypothetical protein LTR59_015335 [Friedmanniomyces endolithicus]KAK0808272.1 hypothetical protein LTR75_006336 [Friedmanniomyces endolithicus]KAK0810448.1 hypothetical protein LTR38_003933 [Friedmanniomyces endolithicus]KAK0838949.1 hypothetical protein LTR03_011608 [Friedmanniomyces endolithicus]